MVDTLIGQVIDNYKILEVLGKGGMGIVFKAMDLNLEKIVALKMIDPYLARDEVFLKKFKTEAKALAKINDPNIVNVYALRETSFGLFMVMEYVNARTLSQWINEKGKFENKETLKIAGQLIHAINCAHKSGVIHRDIKPNNVLLCNDGTVKVMDFGLAKVIQEQGTQQTRTQVAAGTLHYMAPEQIKGIADKRSDIYSIGITIYEMLTGRTPFEKTESEYDVQRKIIEGKILSPLKYNPGIPKQLVRIVMKSIDKDVEKRYQNLDDMIRDLNEVRLHDENEIQYQDDKTRVIGQDLTKEKEHSTNFKGKLLLVGSGVVILIILFIIFIIGNENSGNNKTNKNNNYKNIENNHGTDKGNLSTIKFSQLLITSNPSGASIFIDEKPVGKTPFTRDSLIPHMYSISLKLDGYKTWTEPRYTLKAGNNPINVKLTPVSIAPKTTAALTLKTDIPVNIFIDGIHAASNTKELKKSQIEVGTHTIRFDHPEFGSKETSVNLTNNQNKSLSVYYNQNVSIQVLDTKENFSWGTLYIDNKIVGDAPTRTQLQPGRHEITVKRTGYNTREKVITLDIKPLFENKTHYLVFHLE